MPDTLRHLGGVPVLVCEPEGPVLRGEREALDLIGEAFGVGAEWVAVPASRLGEDFFRLRTRVAGDVIQKFVNYRLGLAVLGDVTSHTNESPALRDFVYESNRGAQTWFLLDAESLADRLARTTAADGSGD
ncbi:DUF4180 domain-containing protein [Planotetraspora kaengkrachanensis]|uniref:DUF4180 domain-containing protein n=1 Tax=Planotetraspora kaengkrachanensis TaxID=575193 RepID=A0A8J3PQI9_9ACTN|nr:DUF4180 domain-containing protein [Planotetraspora kaengkrachanensis]GIG78781.1 hypothetical protein Pka01_19080 [Planotetraspora kaengkrachanensis]